MRYIAVTDGIRQCLTVNGEAAVRFNSQTHFGKIIGKGVRNLAYIPKKITAGFLGIGVLVCRVDNAVVGRYQSLNIVCDGICTGLEAHQSCLTGLAHTV